jgi:hypothetical protein
MPPFPPDPPVPLGPLPDRQIELSEGWSVFIPQIFRLQLEVIAVQVPHPMYPKSPSPIPRPYSTDMRVRQIKLKADFRTLLVQVVQAVDDQWSQTYQNSLKSRPFLVGAIQVRLIGIRCLKSRPSTLLHLQCLLSHLNMNEEFDLNFCLNLSSSLHNNHNNLSP